MKKVSVLGIDLAKNNFSVCGMSADGRVVLRKSVSRRELKEWTGNLPTTHIAFEACGGSHHWARVFRSQGHSIKMMSPQRVKAYSPPQKKNDDSDAESICRAALQASVPEVSTKSVDQQDLALLLNLRAQFVKSKVALVNQLHAVGLEYGVMLPLAKSGASLEDIFHELENAENELTGIARWVMHEQILEIKKLEARIDTVEKKLSALMKENENFKLLKSIPGIGLLTAIAILSHTGGNVRGFKNGRQFAASLGLVPRQFSTGGKTKLLGITSCGSSELRQLLVSGTTAVMRVSSKKSDRRSLWIEKLREKKGFRKTSVALANKTARTVFAVLKTQKPYDLAG